MQKSLTATCDELNGSRQGAYRVTVAQDAVANEVVIRLYENTMQNPIAVAYIDRGHTVESRRECCTEVIGTVSNYLKRN